MKDYNNSITIYAKKSINGGRAFVKYNTAKKVYYFGNTASTAVSDHHSGVLINDVKLKELKEVIRQLESLDYKEFIPAWGNSKDVYKDIERAGL